MVARIISFFVLLSLFHGLLGQELRCGTSKPTLAQQARLDRLIQKERNGGFKVSSGPVEIAILAHNLRRSDGTGGLTEEELQIALDNVNVFYENAGLSFFYLDIRYIDNDKYFDFLNSDESELRKTYNYDGVINVYFANSVRNSSGSYFCGYAYFPGSHDVILMANGCTLNGSTFPHEIGHFFNLYHTHGTTNNGTTDEVVIRPGEESVGCVEPACTPVAANCETNGDRLCDTEADPNVSGKIDSDCNYTEAAVDVNGDAFRPDGTNIMSYSTKSCRNIFTEGQYARMNNTYSDLRSYLHISRTLAYAEVNDKEICEGSMINFNSTGSIHANSYSWTFEGGDPATSMDPNPSVQYMTSGIFDVTLTVSDGEGNEDTEVYTDLIMVRGEIAVNDAPLSGSFEEASLSEMVLSGGSDTWIQTNVGSEGSQSAYVVLVFMDKGQEDYLVLDPINTSVDKTLRATFDYAYAPLDENTVDTLEVVYRDPCGDWISVWSKSGQDLATAPNENQVYFFPTNDQWVSVEVKFNIPEEISVTEIAFKTSSDNGNSLFVDNYYVESYDPSFMISEVNVTNASCTGVADGSFSVTLSKEGSYEFSLDGVNFVSTSTFSDLTDGSYELLVRNTLAYEVTQEIVVGTQNEAPDKPIIMRNEDILSISVEQGLTIQWILNGQELSGETTETLEVSQSGLYTASVSNEFCSSISDEFEVVYDPGFSIANVEVINASCPEVKDGTMMINVEGSGAYAYSIDGVNFQDSNTFSDLAQGSYTITVKNEEDHELSQHVAID